MKAGDKVRGFDKNGKSVMGFEEGKIRVVAREYVIVVFRGTVEMKLKRNKSGHIDGRYVYDDMRFELI